MAQILLTFREDLSTIILMSHYESVLLILFGVLINVQY